MPAVQADGGLLDGATVMVTGASSGIGRELAIQLGGRAAVLVLLARRADRLDQLKNELIATHPDLRVVTIPVDLCDERAVAHVVDDIHAQVGPVDVLVNNAGMGDQVLFDRAEWPRTRQVLHTNVIGLAHLTSAFVPSMVERGRGGVMNIGSGAGLTVMPASAAYSASKHFVDGFSEGLRADLAGTGVAVTQVCPGPVDSEFDAMAGSVGGMTGGPPQFLRISAATCAREGIAGLERDAALVLPGRAYRVAMAVLPLVPRRLLRRRAAKTAAAVRLAEGASALPRSVSGGDRDGGGE
jgi:short-subunit dehydrogenase